MSSDRTEVIEDSASDWLIRRESGKWTQADQARLESWLEASTAHRVAFLRLELAWEDAARLKALGAGIPADQPPAPGQWNLSPFFDAQQVRVQHLPAPPPVADAPTHRGRTRVLAIAASVLLAVVFGFGAHQHWDGGSDRYTTPVGGMTSVPLRDGSNITLNTDSQVNVALTGSERHIELNQGEAFFEVARDPSRPFVVLAGKKRIIAVGTKFSVQRNGDAVEVVVTEGKVRVEDASRPLRRSVIESTAAHHGAADPVFLTAGAIALAGEAGVLVEHRSLEEAETHLSWRNGVLMFRDLSLADAVTEFNRYNTAKIVIADPAVGALKVEGNFRATNAEAFVRLLEDYFPVRVATQQDRIVLSAK